MTHATDEVRAIGPENPSYADLREATEALRRHLAWRLENHTRRAAR